MKFGILLASALASYSFVGNVMAHGGRTDKHGCHTNRKTGDYHCHGSSVTRPQQEYQSLLPSKQSAPSNHRMYSNCDEARAAGAAPVRRGDPGYGAHLDRDNDGVGCEPYKAK